MGPWNVICLPIHVEFASESRRIRRESDANPTRIRRESDANPTRICRVSTHDASWVLRMHHEYSTLDASWILWILMSTHDASWVLIRFVTKWHAMEVERISIKPISMIFRCESLQISNFQGFHFLFSWIFIILNLFWASEGPREHPGTSKHQFEGSWGLQGSFWTHSVLKWLSKKSKNRLLKVFLDRIRRKSEHSVRNRCPVVFQPSIYIKSYRSAAPAPVMS